MLSSLHKFFPSVDSISTLSCNDTSMDGSPDAHQSVQKTSYPLTPLDKMFPSIYDPALIIPPEDVAPVNRFRAQQSVWIKSDMSISHAQTVAQSLSCDDTLDISTDVRIEIILSLIPLLKTGTKIRFEHTANLEVLLETGKALQAGLILELAPHTPLPYFHLTARQLGKFVRFHLGVDISDVEAKAAVGGLKLGMVDLHPDLPINVAMEAAFFLPNGLGASVHEAMPLKTIRSIMRAFIWINRLYIDDSFDKNKIAMIASKLPKDVTLHCLGTTKLQQAFNTDTAASQYRKSTKSSPRWSFKPIFGEVYQATYRPPVTLLSDNVLRQQSKLLKKVNGLLTATHIAKNQVRNGPEAVTSAKIHCKSVSFK